MPNVRTQILNLVILQTGQEEEDFVALLLDKIKKKVKKPSLDNLLEKIQSEGLDSLTPFEKDTLDEYSKN